MTEPRTWIVLAAAALGLAACATVEPQDSTDRPMRYACSGGASFTASYDKDGRRVFVNAGGQAYSLAFSVPNRSVGGLKFMRNGVVLQALGPVASLDGAAGGPYRDCKAG